MKDVSTIIALFILRVDLKSSKNNLMPDVTAAVPMSQFCTVLYNLIYHIRQISIITIPRLLY